MGYEFCYMLTIPQLLLVLRFLTCTLCFFQVYDCLSQVNVCVSYAATLSIMDEVSRLHTVPLAKWIADGDITKFIIDNVNKKHNEAQ